MISLYIFCLTYRYMLRTSELYELLISIYTSVISYGLHLFTIFQTFLQIHHHVLSGSHLDVTPPLVFFLENGVVSNYQLVE